MERTPSAAFVRYQHDVATDYLLGEDRDPAVTSCARHRPASIRSIYVALTATLSTGADNIHMERCERTRLAVAFSDRAAVVGG